LMIGPRRPVRATTRRGPPDPGGPPLARRATGLLASRLPTLVVHGSSTAVDNHVDNDKGPTEHEGMSRSMTSGGSPVDTTEVWRRVVSELEDKGLAARERAFLRLTQLVGILDSTVLLAVPYQHT